MKAQERMKLMREVAVQADLFYEDAKRLGQEVADALTGRRRAQMTGLEGVANSALKVSDVLNYIKTRTARSDPGKDWQKNNLGKNLLEFIETDLKTKSLDPICATMGFAQNSRGAQQVYLHIIRAFIHQMVAHYEYETGIGG